MINKIIFLCLLITASRMVRGEGINYKQAAEILKKSIYESNEYSSTSRFVDFMKDFNRVYYSENELFDRFEYFTKNIEEIEDIQVVDEGTAVYGINQFSDFSEAELESLNGFNSNMYLDSSDEENERKINREKEAINKILNKHKDLPTAFDWRDKKVISKVINQGYCSSCWAFSTIGLVESMNAIRKNNLTELSVQQLVDCDKSNDGCDGGLMHKALKYIQQHGIVANKIYPYKGYNQKCEPMDNSNKVKVHNYTRILPGDEKSMLNWIYNVGPLSIGINARGIQWYTGGIIDLSPVSCNPKNQNHALVLVGFGEEKNAKGTIPYWIIKNSWGSSYGENGYFRLRRDKNVCGISEYVHGATTE